MAAPTHGRVHCTSKVAPPHGLSGVLERFTMLWTPNQRRALTCLPSAARSPIFSTVLPAPCVCLLVLSAEPRRCTNRNCSATAMAPMNGILATDACT